MYPLINKFPIEVASPYRKKCKNKEEFLSYVKNYNHKKNLYFSIYPISLTNPDYIPPMHLLYFDFDTKKAYDCLKKLMNYCLNKKYKFTMVQSSPGKFHFYLFTKEHKSKHLLKNAHLYFIKMLNLDVDKHIIGDYRRVSRILNTYHLKSKHYCIPISKNDVEKGLQHIRELAKNPNPEFSVYGTELVDLNELPEVYKEFTNGNEIPDFDYKSFIEVDDDLINHFPPCVQLWLTNYDFATHRNRFYFSLFCAHSGIKPEECNSLAKKYYSSMKERNGRRNRYSEFKQEKALEYAYGKDFMIPNCNQLYDLGCCKGKCKFYSGNNFYLYKK